MNQRTMRMRRPLYPSQAASLLTRERSILFIYSTCPACRISALRCRRTKRCKSWMSFALDPTSSVRARLSIYLHSFITLSGSNARLVVNGAPAYDEETWKQVRFKPGDSGLYNDAIFHVSCRTVRSVVLA